MSNNKVHVYEGNLEYSSLMPNPERWVKATDYERLQTELQGYQECEKLSRPLECPRHGLVLNLGSFNNKCPNCRVEMLEKILREAIDYVRLDSEYPFDMVRRWENVIDGTPTEAPRPVAWMRSVVSHSGPNEPPEHDAEFSYGDDQPQGEGWKPLYFK